MFTKAAIFSKSNNSPETPKPSWNLDTQIYCAFHLNLEDDHRLEWTHENAPLLQELISFLNEINGPYPQKNNEANTFTFELDDCKINFSWQWTNYNLKLIVGKQYDVGEDLILLDKEFSYHFPENKIRQAIFSQLINSQSKPVLNHYGEILFGNKNPSIASAKFKIGDKVKTIIINNVKTIREGYIIKKFFHSKDEEIMYYLLIDGKLYKSRYRENELELNEPSANN